MVHRFSLGVLAWDPDALRLEEISLVSPLHAFRVFPDELDEVLDRIAVILWQLEFEVAEYILDL